VQQPPTQDVAASKRASLHLRILLFPSGVPSDARYAIEVRGDSLTVQNLQPSSRTDIARHARRLSSAEQDELRALIQQLPPPQVHKSSADDAWAIQMEVNGALVYEKEDFSLDNAEEPYGGLLRYLLSKTPVHIELYGFA